MRSKPLSTESTNGSTEPCKNLTYRAFCPQQKLPRNLDLHSSPHSADWHYRAQLPARLIPSGVKHWLFDPGSLTQRLVKASRGNFRVQVLSQHWQRPSLSEQRLLGMKTRQVAIIREVALLCHGEPWVFARSIIPATSVTGPLRRLRKFDDSSLGSLLFKDPSMQRDGFQICQLPVASSYLPKALENQTKLWGRRSRFLLKTKPLIVSEVFLPAFLARH